MRIRDVAGGIAAGYLARALQLMASIALVPFLVRDDILGLAGYGEVFTLLSFSAVLNLVTDGLRVSFARSISLAIVQGGRDVRDLLGSSLKLFVGVAAVFVATSALFSKPILDMVGIGVTQQMQQALVLACGVAVVETVPYGFESHVLARGRMVFLNSVRSIEVVVRTVLFFVVLSHLEASPRSYLVIMFVTIGARQAALAAYVRAGWPGDVRGWMRAPLHAAWQTALYSLPVSGSSASFYILNRFTVILANRFLGATESGYVALVLNTLDRYVGEVLFSVVRPILVPVASRLTPSSLSTSARRWLYQADALYSAVMLVTVFALVTLLPLGIPLWLGRGYDAFVLPMQLMLVGTAARLATSVRQSMLIAHGHAKHIAIVSALALIPVMAGMLAGVFAYGSWAAIVAGISAYYVVSSIFGVSGEFERIVPPPVTYRVGGGLRFALILGAMAAVSLTASRAVMADPRGMEWLWLALAWLGSVAGCAGIADRFLIRLRDASETLRKLRDDSHRELSAGVPATVAPEPRL